jgi:hypothetical protein
LLDLRARSIDHGFSVPPVQRHDPDIDVTTGQTSADKTADDGIGEQPPAKREHEAPRCQRGRIKQAVGTLLLDRATRVVEQHARW